jgi:hypothetical protein
MAQGLGNAPATFNRCVSHLLWPALSFEPSYFDDVFIHSRAMDGKSDVKSTDSTFVRFRSHTYVKA